MKSCSNSMLFIGYVDLFSFLGVIPGTKTRGTHIQGKCSTNEPHSGPVYVALNL